MMRCASALSRAGMSRSVVEGVFVMRGMILVGFVACQAGVGGNIRVVPANDATLASLDG